MRGPSCRAIEEELVVDACDHERTALWGLAAQCRQQHPEVTDDGWWQRLAPPLTAIAEGRDREPALCHDHTVPRIQ